MPSDSPDLGLRVVADTEKKKFGYFFSSPTIVLFPTPPGPESTSSFPLIDSAIL